MQKNLTYRIILIIAVILTALISLYPPRLWLFDMNFGIFKKLPPTLTLGLDLQGGMHMIIQIDTKYIEEMAAKDKSINVEEYKNIALQKTLDILRNRIDEFGVAEPSIKKLSDDRIEIELPGLRDPERAKNLAKEQAVLEFRMVHKDNDLLLRDLVDEKGNLLPGKVVPENYILLYEYPRRPDGQFIMEEDGITRKKIPYLISNKIELRGEDLKTADVTMHQEYNKPVIAFKLKTEAAQKFEELTEKYRPRNTTDNNRLAIILDNKVIMAPRINSRISGGSGIIEGNFTLTEAQDMAIKLRSGSLPVPINIIEEQTVGPTLGADSIKRGIQAAYIGTFAVIT
ncbi:MAG TPA: hypothetical protein PLJ38_10525, partial [bacterium]|nr:hypothetical protein [bacterium]